MTGPCAQHVILHPALRSKQHAQGRDRLRFLRQMGLPDVELGAFWHTVISADARGSAGQPQSLWRTARSVWCRWTTVACLALGLPQGPGLGCRTMAG